MHIYTLPGLYNSGPKHWQTKWEEAYGYTRILQDEWEKPVCEDWISRIDSIVSKEILDEVVLVGHSLATSTIVRWAEKYKRIIKGALLVAPSDVESAAYPPGTQGFHPMPVFKLSFPSIVIASTDDIYVTMERAEEFSSNWGSELINVGALGHINSDSDLGLWPNGHEQLKKLLK